MWGAIAGDIIGSAYERHNTNRYDFELFPPGATFTDDTVLTVAVMEHLLDRNTGLADLFRKWCQRYPDAGYGPGFLAWLGGHAPGDSRGNGAAMRVSPIAWMPYEMDEMYEAAEAQARLTHDSEEALYAVRQVVSAIRLTRDGFGKKTLRRMLAGGPGEYRRLSWPPGIKKPGPLAKESVPVALAAAVRSESFEDAIRKAVSVGGDSDTIASIAGAVAEAIYLKVPDEILYEVRDRLPRDILEVVDYFYYNWVGPDAGHPVGPREDVALSTTGQQTPKARLSARELPADDPIYTRGFAVGVMRSTGKKEDK